MAPLVVSLKPAPVDDGSSQASLNTMNGRGQVLAYSSSQLQRHPQPLNASRPVTSGEMYMERSKRKMVRTLNSNTNLGNQTTLDASKVYDASSLTLLDQAEDAGRG